MIARFLFPQQTISLNELVPLVRVRSVGGIQALLPYRHPTVRTLIKRTKFGNSRESAEILGAILKQYLDTLGSPDIVIVPIPLHPLRRLVRGYNQVERIARKSGYPVACVLRRTRYSTPQAKKKKEDRSTLTGAFRVESALSGTVIVLDDVVTTGNTMKAACAAFACPVHPLALAH